MWAPTNKHDMGSPSETGFDAEQHDDVVATSWPITTEVATSVPTRNQDPVVGPTGIRQRQTSEVLSEPVDDRGHVENQEVRAGGFTAGSSIGAVQRCVS
jgi:hypothetical protein